MQDQYVDVAGCRLRYRETGQGGTTLLFLHGIGGSLELWTRQQELARDGLRLIFLDLPGHGLSAPGNQPYEPGKFADVALQFLEKLGLQTATVVGNSMGGGIALLMADKAPSRISRLLLADAATLGRFSPLPFRLMTLPVLGSLMTKPGKAAVEQQIKAIFHEPQSCATEEIRAVITRNASSSEGQKAFLSTLRLMTDLGGQRPAMFERAHAALKKLTIPVVFLHGRQDVVLPLQHSVDAQAMTRNSRLVVLENCGHTPQLEKPAEFNTAVRALLDM